MASILVVYDSKYGNTKRTAEAIAEGLRDMASGETSVSVVKEVEVGAVAGRDASVLGVPNHMAKLSQTMMKSVGRLARVDLKAK